MVIYLETKRSHIIEETVELIIHAAKTVFKICMYTACRIGPYFLNSYRAVKRLIVLIVLIVSIN